MNKTNISWTEWIDEKGNKRKGFTWNVVTGCTSVSEGCAHCYARAWSHRWNRSFEVTLHPEKLEEAKKIPPGSKVFVNSMSDLFHPDVPFDFIYSAFVEMYHRKDVTFQILTKRPERMREFFRKTKHPITKNMWLGVSVESPEYVDRTTTLLAIFHDDYPHYVDPDNVAFVSFEPLLSDMGDVNLRGIDWVIIGGESGPRHRPMKTEWARNLVKQAREQDIAVWMKQLGGLHPGGELDSFPEDLRIREFPGEMKIMEDIS